MTVRPRPDGVRAINLVPLRDLLNYDVDALDVTQAGRLTRTSRPPSGRAVKSTVP